ncbi:LCP family protein required for cell wall assembly [Kibdelosporangium banguiense]|uniref:LCP family protein required for cell wall assembly n=1 Tax=Kibdelosporangium banguiense TaxID=1365924 RepID=A0ABS4T871_9PSEU|nr:LCP family protein [Kibdelosporangium banguiense]MBP2320051.1 LCP family protein required for cell wall assembly [Kibdelosporangium banguiense]
MNAKKIARITTKSLIAVVSLAVLAVTAGGWWTYRTATTNLATDDVIVPETPDAPQASTGDSPTPVRKPPQDTTILLVGLDSRTDAQGNPLPRNVLDALQAGNSTGEQNTDTMMVIHVPADPTKKAFAISLPRDSYVDIAGGFGKHKLNSAYARAKNAAAGQGEKESTTAGRRNLIATINQLTGLHIDHYAEINLFGFSEITNAVGGVPVCLNNPVKDSYSGANFPAGPQTLQGIDALKFVRQRHGLTNGDLDRVRRQQAFLAGLANRMFSAGTLTDPSRISDLVSALTKAVVLDKGWDLMSFAQQLGDLTGDKIQFTTIPTGRINLATPSDGSAVEVNPNQVRAFVQNLLDPPAAPPVQRQPDADAAGKIIVNQERVQRIANVEPINAGAIPCVD